jgi:hypothetical protein
MDALAFLMIGIAIFWGPLWGILFGLVYVLGGFNALFTAFVFMFLSSIARRL